MKLSELTAAIKDLVISVPAEDPAIDSIHYRAQDVQKGGIFVAIAGLSADGHDFIDVAIAKGAAAVVVGRQVSSGVPQVRVKDTRAALAQLSARFFGEPSKGICLIGVTGTNGKTTTTYLIESILKTAGYKTGVIGTINCRYDDIEIDSLVTTPESLDLQRILSEMVRAGVTHVIMEVSSHGVDLKRIEGCAFDVGVFTNLSQDHLDYHPNMEAYWECKKRFFTHHLAVSEKKAKAIAVLNTDSDEGRLLAGCLEIPVLTVGSHDGDGVHPDQVRFDLNGITGWLQTKEKRISLKSSLVGRHNLENILCAVGVGTALGISLDLVGRGIDAAVRVPGRLESVTDPGGRYVFVDYAHTPDALEKALRTLKSLTDRRVICVFGAGGNRDRGKRPKMGEIAGKLADFTIITSDNPRMESPGDIVGEVAFGIEPINRQFKEKDLLGGYPGNGYCLEPDREKAIRLGLQIAQPGDAVLIAGKGHETYQVMGPVTIPFDDRKAVAKAVAYLAGPIEGKAEWTSRRIAEATGGTVVSEHPGAGSALVSIDSRTATPEAAFIAIVGSKHDGHRFLSDVVTKGIRSLVVREDRLLHLPMDQWKSEGVHVVAVPDTTRALGDMAADLRRRNPVSVIAITGSNGKTSTRKMCAEIAKAKGYVLSTEGNLNNEFGLPLTLLGLKPFHQWAVLELGMNRPGEILRLSEICRPDIAVITNIGPAHLEGVGSIEGVMSAKAEILSHLHPKGAVVLNADCEHSMVLARKLSKKAFLFGRSPQAHIKATWVVQADGHVGFVLESPSGAVDIKLSTPGAFMVSNALAAAAVGYLMGLSLEAIRSGLESFTPISGRLRVNRTRLGIHIVDDTYNANPMSMKAALDTVKAMAEGKRTLFVAGDMYELGGESEALHKEIGRHAVADGYSKIYAVGNFAHALAEGAIAAGLKKDRVFVGTKDQVIERLRNDLESADWVLVKGSRGMAMETVVSALMNP
jgi:MurE/MurF fusion protein